MSLHRIYGRPYGRISVTFKLVAYVNSGLLIRGSSLLGLSCEGCTMSRWDCFFLPSPSVLSGLRKLLVISLGPSGSTSGECRRHRITP